MGEVYRARDSRLKRDVAVKVLPASFSSDPDRLRRFEQEAQAAGSLNHPNIIAVYDVGTHDGAPYVVSELLEGQTLRGHLAGGSLSPRQAVDCAAQIAQGLAAAHEKGIVHRDLKPENVFVMTDGRLKILDFGLAKLTQTEPGGTRTDIPTAAAEGTEPGVVLGTLGYMSPEQVRGQPADHRSDIFSFGAILYELLSGQRAFRGGSAADTMSAILREDPTDLSVTNRAISPGLDRILRHCLEKNPEKRFQSARDLAFDLETLSGVSGQAAIAPAALPGPRRRAAIVAAVSALVLLPAAAYLAGRRVERAGRADPPAYHQLTYRHGSIQAARFAPDGQTIMLAAAWDGGPLEIFSTRLEFPETRPLGLPGEASLLSVSSRGELAIVANGQLIPHGMFRGTVSRVALAGGAPREIAENVIFADWSPDGQTLAVVRMVEGHYRLEFPAGRVLYETPGWIAHARVSPKGDRIAFLEHPVWPDDRGSVVLVDLSGKTRTLSTGWESEQGLAWSPDGKEVFFTSSPAGIARDLYAVDLSGRQRLVARVPGGMVLQDIFRDGRVLMTRSTERLSALYLGPGEERERDLSWLDWSLPKDLSPDGKTLLFCEEGRGGGPHYTACLRGTDGSPVVRLGEGSPSEFSPDGKWVLVSVSTSPEQLLLLPTGPGEPRRLDLGTIKNTLYASFFPDGRRILICGMEPAGTPGLYTLDLSGGKPRRIAEGLTIISSRHISPDGKTVVALDAAGKLVLLRLDGGLARPLPGSIPNDTALRWSDGGDFFVAQGRKVVEIFRLDVATGRREPWRTLAPPDPAGVRGSRPILLSADGKSLVYGCYRVLSDLYIVEGLR
jgi:Tol biopolymer transport system component